MLFGHLHTTKHDQFSGFLLSPFRLPFQVEGGNCNQAGVSFTSSEPLYGGPMSVKPRDWICTMGIITSTFFSVVSIACCSMKKHCHSQIQQLISSISLSPFHVWHVEACALAGDSTPATPTGYCISCYMFGEGHFRIVPSLMTIV